MTLYEMSDAAKHLYELLATGEIDEQTVLDTMESIGASEKLESYVYVQKQLEAEISAFEKEIDRMIDRKAVLENRVKRLKQAQVDFMQATGQKSANAGTFRLSLRRNASVNIEDEGIIPMRYMVEIPATMRPDKKQMLADMKDGKTIPGASVKISYSVTAK